MPEELNEHVEEWAPVAGFEGFYEISDHGRVKSLLRWVGAAGGKQRMIHERVLHPGLASRGYRYSSLRRDGVSHRFGVHRLVLTAFAGPCPDGMECRHLNGVRTDNRIENLRWGTKLENAKDRTLHGTENIGEKHGHSKLTEPEVIEMRKCYAVGGLSHRDIATMFGISKSQTGHILRGKYWKHIEGTAS